jgi:hypothetical protein
VLAVRRAEEAHRAAQFSSANVIIGDWPRRQQMKDFDGPGLCRSVVSYGKAVLLNIEVVLEIMEDNSRCVVGVGR